MFNKNQQQKAMTLAETLITLGIIGVVAAMTIPNVIMSHQKSQTITQLKSTYTILNNALEMAKVENGTDVSSWYIPNTSTAEASKYFAENYFLPYLKTTKVCGSSTSAECVHTVGFTKNLTLATKSYFTISGGSDFYSFTLINGAIVRVALVSITGTSVANSRVLVDFDINGKKLPNLMGKDSFKVELGGDFGSGEKNKFFPYALEDHREDLLNTLSGACSKTKGTGECCFAVIMKDGWQIKDDYPWN